MRVAHVTDCYLPRMGGIERQVEGLTRTQAGVGYDVNVITSVRPEQRVTAESDPDQVVVIGPSRQSVFESLRRPHPGSIRYQSALSGRRAVIDGGYDLVHIHASTFSPLSYLAAGAATSAGIPTVVTLHSLWSWATPIFRGFDLALDWRRWPLTWTAVSEAAAQSLSHVLRPDTPISIMPNGVSPELWHPQRQARRPDRVVIISVMRLAARKRPMCLLKMLREVRAQTPANILIEVKIVGDGPKREAMLGYLRRHRMAGWVTLTGQLDQSEIRQLYDDADLYISPATLESFGIAALEARCAGLPVIAFAETGVADFISHGRNGLLVDSDAEMAAAITDLVRSPAVRMALTEHNLQTESGFSWESLLQTCESVYAGAFDQAGQTMPARPDVTPQAAITAG